LPSESGKQTLRAFRVSPADVGVVGRGCPGARPVLGTWGKRRCTGRDGGVQVHRSMLSVVLQE
jgi:hypothetical protein